MWKLLLPWMLAAGSEVFLLRALTAAEQRGLRNVREPVIHLQALY